ncbi:hypothetical protein BaRGS_00000885 [Batillaria attramentaria]|uniref:Uncharacterized protein n=1 Tax=Batillaria attramentaria TaxID=370345 RepID=A0ABD0M7K5_9CAEN
MTTMPNATVAVLPKPFARISRDDKGARLENVEKQGSSHLFTTEANERMTDAKGQSDGLCRRTGEENRGWRERKQRPRRCPQSRQATPLSTSSLPGADLKINNQGLG